MRQIIPLLLPLLALLPQPAEAQVIAYDFEFPASEGGGDSVSSDAADEDGYGYEGDEDGDDDAEADVVDAVPDAGARRLPPLADEPSTLAPARSPRVAYGPFRVVDESRAVMTGVTDSATPAAFGAMLRDHPGIATIEMVDCPGTEDDRANLRLGRMIRERGIATNVPANGWVASGAVELFLAGVQRSAAPGARFAVHSWEDDTGRGPNDYSADAPKNRAYLDYYRAMGMSDGEARGFYAMTNSTPFSRARALTAADMARWTRIERPGDWQAMPRGTFAQASRARGPLATAAF